ncbi:hypothetical protein [Collinsella provencensis]|uniref:hypothetical protein n=1 Tax=Collinsella provencensis TaxID=1937461 RepID=UPI000C862A2D|nr:hypothetical protein [Collinsella provencensis]
MAEHYSFFDAQGAEGSYDRTYSSADLASYFASFIGNGVYVNPANQLKVSPANGKMAVNVAVGKAWINGYFYELSESAKELTIATGDANNPRIDKVVCSLNLSNRLIELKVIQGAASANPQAPAHSREDEVFDLVLAEVHVASGAVELSEEDITDKRPDNTVCGFVTGVVEQIDTTGLFSQYDAEFNTWFEGIQGILDEDTAGNLANQITAIQEQMAETLTVEKGGTGATTAEQARTNLGAAAASHTHAISDVSGTLPVSQGGTGATTAYAALQALGITLGTSAAPSTGTANTIYIQLL